MERQTNIDSWLEIDIKKKLGTKMIIEYNFGDKQWINP